MKSLSILSVVGFLLAVSNANAQDCGEYVILGCFKDVQSAQARSNNLGGALVLDTSSPRYPNFSPGWFCAAQGPYAPGSAASDQTKRYWQANGIPDAYIKNAC